MPRITIKGTIIDLPASGASPNWSPAIIEAFQAIADAVNVFTGTFDVAPQTKNIDIYNSSSNIDIDNLIFPSSDVRASTIFYTVFRQTEESSLGAGDQQSFTESGTLEINYNESRPSNMKWSVGRIGEDDALIDFNVTDLGQVQLSTSPLTGINHTGIISYRAISILNSN